MPAQQILLEYMGISLLNAEHEVTEWATDIFAATLNGRLVWRIQYIYCGSSRLKNMQIKYQFRSKV